MIAVRAALLALLAAAAAASSGYAQTADPSDVAPSLRPGVAAYRAGDLATAEQALRRLSTGDADAEAWLGVVLIQRGRSREGIQSLQHAADAGSAEGAHRLALVFAQGGEGVARDEAKALQLFEKAAAAGHRRAQINAGILRLRGDGPTRDLVQARAWLEKAAAQDDPYALYTLGRAMEESAGSALADPVRAADLYRRAAQLGHPQAALRYGLALNDGIGVRKDPAAAQTWLLQAQKIGVPEAALALGDISARLAVSRDKAANASALKVAISWYEAAAYAGVASAQLKLANAYLAGASVPRDPQQAQQWYVRAANQGLPEAQYALGIFLIGGVAGATEPVEGYKWLLLAERAGYVDSRVVREKAAEKIAEPDRKRAEALADRFAAQSERPLNDAPARLAAPGRP